MGAMVSKQSSTEIGIKSGISASHDARRSMIPAHTLFGLVKVEYTARSISIRLSLAPLHTRTFHTSPLLHTTHDTTSSLAVVHSLPVHRYRSVELHGEARRAHVGQLLHGLGASESAMKRATLREWHVRVARKAAKRRQVTAAVMLAWMGLLT